jgi:hypothetical protein
MSLFKHFIPFILLGCISYFLDIYTAPKGYYSKCIQLPTVHAELLLHHILNMFSQFGWLSASKTILMLYIMSPILVLAHWATNNNSCYLTERINERCKLPKKILFRDWWSLLGLKGFKWYNAAHKSFLVVGWCIAVYRLKYF